MYIQEGEVVPPCSSACVSGVCIYMMLVHTYMRVWSARISTLELNAQDTFVHVYMHVCIVGDGKIACAD